MSFGVRKRMANERGEIKTELLGLELRTEGYIYRGKLLVGAKETVNKRSRPVPFLVLICFTFFFQPLVFKNGV